MTARIVACVLSVVLHGFLLSQWPSPFVQVPSWHADETLEVVYLPPAPPAPAKQDVAPAQEVTVRRLSAVLENVRPEPPRAGDLSRSSRSASGHGVPSDARDERARAGSADFRAGEIERGPANGHPERGLPIPSLLTLDEVSHFTYKQQVRSRLQRTIRYPAAAVVRRGSVRLRVAIARDGRVVEAACLAADAPVFAQATMAGVTDAGPFAAFPQDLPEATLTYEFEVAFQPGTATTVSP